MAWDLWGVVEEPVTILLLSRYATGNNSYLLSQQVTLFCDRA